jgi:hypothetical protein
MSVWAMRGGMGVHQGCVGIPEGEGGYRDMHVVIVGGAVGMVSGGLRMVPLRHTRHNISSLAEAPPPAFVHLCRALRPSFVTCACP